MQTLTLPCDTDAGDTLTMARLGGCAALTVRARQHQVNLTPADARKAAAWLLACAVEIEASLARLRAGSEQILEALPCHPGCRTVTGEVNRNYCPRCKNLDRVRERTWELDPPTPARIDSAAPSGGLGGAREGGLASTTTLTIEGASNASGEVVL